MFKRASVALFPTKDDGASGHPVMMDSNDNPIQSLTRWVWTGEAKEKLEPPEQVAADPSISPCIGLSLRTALNAELSGTTYQVVISTTFIYFALHTSLPRAIIHLKKVCCGYTKSYNNRRIERDRL